MNKTIFDDLFISDEELELMKLEKAFIIPDLEKYCFDKALEHHKLALHFQEWHLHFKKLNEVGLSNGEKKQ